MKLLLYLTAGVLALLFALLLIGNPGPSFVQTSSAVQIPTELKLAFSGYLIAAMTMGAVWLLSKTGLDVREHVAPLAGTIATFLLGIAQGWIDAFPAQYDPVVQTILNVLVVILTGVGTYWFFAARKVKPDPDHYRGV